MSLRLRLVVVFFLVSVVPLAAVTLYTYANNVKAVRETAQREADMLAAELGARMEQVTAQLSQRVGDLVTLAAVQAPELQVEPAAATAAQAHAADEGADDAVGEAERAALEAERVRDVLGEMAVLLDNVEIFDRRGRGRFLGRGLPPGIVRPPVIPGGAPGPGPAGPTGGPPGALPGPTPAPDGPPVFAGRLPGERLGSNGRPRLRPGLSDGDGPPPAAAAAPGDPPTPAAGGDSTVSVDTLLDPDRILIDMEPIRREIIRQIVPEGQWEQLGPEERARVFAEVQQRLLGIRQGIDILRQEVTERAAAAAVAPPDVTSAPLEDAPKPVPTEPPGNVIPPDETPLQRRAELSRGRIDVSLERGGEVVGQANAAINLPNLLGMLFTSTRRERGEVPFAVAGDGRVFAPTPDDRDIVREVAPQVVSSDAAPADLLLSDWVVVTRPDPTGSVVKFGIARPLGAAVEQLRRTAVRNAGVGLAFIALALLVIVPLSSRLTRDLERLSAGVNRIAQGDYTARVEVRGGDEVARLAAAFNHMAAEVETHQRTAVEQERIRRELELGRQIQSEMLPHAPLRVGDCVVTGLSIPAREVSGDFFNYFPLADGTIALIIGDVSGKGVGAALLMANLQAALRTRLVLGQDLARLATELDEEIDRSTPGPVYATLFLGVLDPTRRMLRWVNAGHNPQYVLRGDGRLERLESVGRPIGLLAGGGYAQVEVELQPGDLLFCYTDGCVDVENEAGDAFGNERLERLLLRAAGTPADEAIAVVRDAMSRFRGGAELQDDATLMATRIG